jgi:hypothetical protein
LIICYLLFCILSFAICIPPQTPPHIYLSRKKLQLGKKNKCFFCCILRII